jgi:ribosomal protein S21
MSVEKPQFTPQESAEGEVKTEFEAFFKDKSKKGQKEEPEEVKERKAELEQKAVTLAQEAERAFSSNDLDQALEKLREIQRTVGLEMVENREQYEKFEQEFNRQIDNLAKKGFQKLAGVDEKKFAAIFEPLKEKLKELSSREFQEGRIPFVVVPRDKLLALEKQMPLVELDGKKGFTGIDDVSEFFTTAEGVKIPEAMAYLVVDIENGKVMLGKSADEAVKQFKKEGRSPLTADEGVAIILQHPEILKDHYMDLAGSRHGGGRVADLWLDGGEPRLDWNYSGNSNSRWGSASCGSRVGP